MSDARNTPVNASLDEEEENAFEEQDGGVLGPNGIFIGISGFP